MKIGILGANGQVGSELCLHLSKMSNFELIPICRNQMGSAFLRYNGISCRHGSILSPTESQKLIGDCDVIVNTIFHQGSPSETRKIELDLAKNIFFASRSDAKIIYFSTLCIYGNGEKAVRFRSLGFYGRLKRRSEKIYLNLGNKFKKQVFVLRPGNVTGEFQNISLIIRNTIKSGKPIELERDRASNCTSCLTIVDAIKQIACGFEKPGVYDLVNVPQWTWSQVYEHEAKILERPLTIKWIPTMRCRPNGFLRDLLSFLTRLCTVNQLKEIAYWYAGYLPNEFFEKLKAVWRIRNARRSIDKMKPPSQNDEVTDWSAKVTNQLGSLTDTRNLLFPTSDLKSPETH